MYLRKTRSRSGMLYPALLGLAPFATALAANATHARPDALWFDIAPSLVPAVTALGQVREWRGRSGTVFYVAAAISCAALVVAFLASP